ncbi:unnamed protein product, partial [Coregonus sp. 'balchen']
RWLYPDLFYTHVKPWLYLALSLLGFLGNGLPMRNCWRSGRTPTIILTLNMVTSDLLLCGSFLFRVMYYLRGQIWSGEDRGVSGHHANHDNSLLRHLYCNMVLLLWTSAASPCPPYAPHQAQRLQGILPRHLGNRGNGEEEKEEQDATAALTRFNNQPCLGVGLFFVILTFILVCYGGLMLHLKRVRGAWHKPTHTSEGGCNGGAGLTMLSPHGGDCEKVRTRWKVNNATITIAALS